MQVIPGTQLIECDLQAAKSDLVKQAALKNCASHQVAEDKTIADRHYANVSECTGEANPALCGEPALCSL